MSVGSPKGNKNGIKLKDPEARQEAYRQYCKHISEGWPKEAFFFDHPTDYACWKTIERYINESTIEFPPSMLMKAKAMRYQHWLNQGKNLLTGAYVKGSSSVWQTIMRNIFKDIGWDRDELPIKVTEETIKPFIELMNQLADAQAKSERNTALTKNSSDKKSE